MYIPKSEPCVRKLLLSDKDILCFTSVNFTSWFKTVSNYGT